MYLSKINQIARRAVYFAVIVGITMIAFLFVAKMNKVDARSSAGEIQSAVFSPMATFPASNTFPAAIPDSPGGTPPTYGTPLVINYPVTGVSGPVTDVSVSITLTHSWAGDLDMVLAAPGGSPNLVVVGHIGVQTAGSFGSSSDYLGTYVFTDTASGPNIWTAAASTPIPAGSYRTTARGGPGQTNPPPVTSLNTTFGGLTPAQANGTWTLTIRDGGGGDTGSVTASSLTINPTGAPIARSRTVDFDGDNKTDFSVVRATSATAQMTWLNKLNNVAGTESGVAWGLGFGYWSNQVNLGDAVTPADFDGDGKSDVAVWRAGAATVASFYILQSATNTARVVPFGQAGDDPTVVDDYDGDGKADLAVYRPGTGTTSPGSQGIYFYQGSLSNPGNNITYLPWGTTGDFSAPGDYDGDGKADAAIYRPGGGVAPQNAYWIRNSSNGAAVYYAFGQGSSGLLSRGGIAKGDFDGDGKNDLCWIQRVAGGQLQWWIRSSLTGNITQTSFGLQATDLPTPGDYDGDGKTDLSVWRTGSGADASIFYWRPSSGGIDQQAKWGSSVAALSVPDYPTAAYNFH